MKLFNVFSLYASGVLAFCSVKMLATEAIKTLNGIDFANDSLSSFINSAIHHPNANATVSHSRGKRFIAFPVGSSFSTAVCLTTGVLGNPNYQYLSLGLNWGIAYELPNATWVLQQANGFGSKDSEEIMQAKIGRRHRRDLYGKMETLINGYVAIIIDTDGNNPSNRQLLKVASIFWLPMIWQTK